MNLKKSHHCDDIFEIFVDMLSNSSNEIHACLCLTMILIYIVVIHRTTLNTLSTIWLALILRQPVIVSIRLLKYQRCVSVSFKIRLRCCASSLFWRKFLLVLKMTSCSTTKTTYLETLPPTFAIPAINLNINL